MDDNLIIDANGCLNQRISISFINSLVSHIDLVVEAEQDDRYIYNICFTEKRHPSIAVQSNDLKYGPGSWYYSKLKDLVEALCFQIQSFEIDGKIVSNPYLGCKTIDQLYMKRDLYG